MLKTLIGAVLAFVVFDTPAYAGAQRACAVSAVQKFSSVCPSVVPRNFSQRARDINYCPIPKEKEIPTS